MMKSSRASLVRSSSTRVRGDSRGAINIPNFGSYGNKRLTVFLEKIIIFLDKDNLSSHLMDPLHTNQIYPRFDTIMSWSK